MSAFDLPDLLAPCEPAWEAADLDLEPAPPLPVCTEPSAPTVTEPVDEAMILVDDGPLAVIPAYASGGWRHATEAQWLRTEVHDRVVAAASSLPPGIGLVVLDAWRPLELQIELHDAAVADPAVPVDLIAPPSADPATPPPHLTGGAVDCTLTIDGVAVGLGTGFDDITCRARADAFERTPGPARELRRLLYWTMRRQGFIVFAGEWWHFEFGTRRWAAVAGAAPRYGPASPPRS